MRQRWLPCSHTRSLSKEALSRTISLTRITMILGLIFVHYQVFPNSDASPFDGAHPTQHQAATFINSFVLFFFFSAVPLLSMLSGWLFFGFGYGAEPAGDALRDRIRQRFRSLYLPLVFWNGLLLLGLVALWNVSPDHALLGRFDLDPANAGTAAYVNAVLAIADHPVAFQFWFVRDLFLTVLLSPLLWQLLQRAPMLSAVALGAAWMAGSELLVFFRTDVLFFFFLGGLLRIQQAPLQIPWRTTLALLALYVMLVALRASAPWLLDMADQRPVLLTAATRAMRLVGVLACWGLLLRLAATEMGARMASLGGLAFFVFAVHFPLIVLIKQVLWTWLPGHSQGWMLAHYLGSIGLTGALALMLGWALSRGFPRVFSWMNGGRGVQRPATP